METAIKNDTTMKLKDAKLCLQCETIHIGWECPHCGKGPSYFLIHWINRTQTILELAQTIDNNVREYYVRKIRGIYEQDL